VALVDPIYDCLFRLAQPDALMNEEEVKGLAHKHLEVNFYFGKEYLSVNVYIIIFNCLLHWCHNLVSN